MRGKPIQRVQRCGRLRSIPAHAGETRQRPFAEDHSRVHPRACGGNVVGAGTSGERPGPSPRMRGKLNDFYYSHSTNGSIPAHAGETHGGSVNLTLPWVHPRACGGNPSIDTHPDPGVGPSPRMRGKPSSSGCHPSPPGSIPAHAGETPPHFRSRARSPVHPRACGGNAVRPVGVDT